MTAATAPINTPRLRREVGCSGAGEGTGASNGGAVSGGELLAAGQLDPDAETVVFNTGDGLKTLDAVTPTLAPAIDPTIEAFEATYPSSTEE